MTDFTSIVTKMWNQEAAEESPGAQLLAESKAEIAATQREQKRVAAESAWNALSAQNVSPGYNYTDAYAGGATFKPGPDGAVTLPNKYAAPMEHNLAGYDLTTGKKYRNVLDQSPETEASVLALRESSVDQNGVAPMKDVRPLSQLATDFRKKGMGYEEFDR